MDDLKDLAPTSAGETSVPPTKAHNPYRVFFWGGLIMAAMCVYLATTRLAIKRPARADAYFITGIFGVLSAAMAFSLGKASERTQRTQQSLKDSLDRLQDSMKDMPRELMEESVRVAAREAESRRADQERQAHELRTALESGIQSGFAPMAPALAGRIEESLKGLSESLRSDREERAASLRATTDTVSALQAAQADWSKASSALLTQLREQGTTLHNDLGARDTAARTAWEANTASARAAWEQLAASARAAWEQSATASTQGIQATLDGQMAKVSGLVESLSSRWDETLHAQRESFAGEWREVLAKSQAQLEQGATTVREAITEASATVRTVTVDAAGAVRSASEEASSSVQSIATEVDARLGATSAQAEEWLRNLSAAAGTIGEAIEGMRRSGEETSVQQAAGQAEWRATVEMFHQGMGGLLDRLQALGSYAQAQEALLKRMDETIRAFEERSADLIEETALKAQESLLDALDQAGARDTSETVEAA